MPIQATPMNTVQQKPINQFQEQDFFEVPGFKKSLPPPEPLYSVPKNKLMSNEVLSPILPGPSPQAAPVMANPISKS